MTTTERPSQDHPARGASSGAAPGSSDTGDGKRPLDGKAAPLGRARQPAQGWLVLLSVGVVAVSFGWAWLAIERPPPAPEPLVEPLSGTRDTRPTVAGAPPTLPELAPLPELLPIDTTPARRAPRSRPDVVSRASRR